LCERIPVAGHYLVDAEGNVQFGGDSEDVSVKGLTLEGAEEVIARQLGGIEELEPTHRSQ
jgi:hypothetical protein